MSCVPANSRGHSFACIQCNRERRRWKKWSVLQHVCRGEPAVSGPGAYAREGCHVTECRQPSGLGGLQRVPDAMNDRDLHGVWAVFEKFINKLSIELNGLVWIESIEQINRSWSVDNFYILVTELPVLRKILCDLIPFICPPSPSVRIV